MGETIYCLNELKLQDGLEYIQNAIKKLKIPYSEIKVLNWDEYNYIPHTSFQMIFLNNGIYLSFQVIEIGVRGLILEDNGEVYKDSCVELFIDPDGNGTYYNFEFNCIGTTHHAYGISRYQRELSHKDILNTIIRKPSLGYSPVDITNQKVYWDLEVLIPCSALFRHTIDQLKSFYCNVYKCGGKDNYKHYLSWFPIESSKPDFHRPEFFKRCDVIPYLRENK